MGRKTLFEDAVVRPDFDGAIIATGDNGRAIGIRQG